MARKEFLAINMKLPKRGFSKAQRAFAMAAMRNKSPEFNEAFERVGAAYNVYIKDDYQSNSSGGGRWPDLAPSTVKSKKQNKSLIMVHFGDLYGVIPNAFVSTSGWTCQHIRGGISCGYTFANKHPNSRLTYGKLAHYHAVGKGKLPRRKIVIAPDGRFKTRVKQIMTRAAKNVFRNAARLDS